MGKEAILEMERIRPKISALEVQPSESLTYYTGAIASLLDVVVGMSQLSKDAEIARDIQAYVNFVQCKEQAGIERATLAGVFSKDRFEGDAYTRWTKLIGSQEIYLRVFKSFATEAQIDFYEKTVTGTEVSEVEQFRKIASEKRNQGEFGVAPSAWFKASTKGMDLMKKVEDQVAADCMGVASRIESKAFQALIWYFTLTGVILAATIVLGVLLIRSIIHPLQVCTQAVKRLADGDLTAEIHIHRQDEIGILAESIAGCTSYLRSLVQDLQTTSSTLVTCANILLDTANNQAAAA